MVDMMPVVLDDAIGRWIVWHACLVLCMWVTWLTDMRTVPCAVVLGHIFTGVPISPSGSANYVVFLVCILVYLVVTAL